VSVETSVNTLLHDTGKDDMTTLYRNKCGYNECIWEDVIQLNI
jgi:hypothetical protein